MALSVIGLIIGVGTSLNAYSVALSQSILPILLVPILSITSCSRSLRWFSPLWAATFCILLES